MGLADASQTASNSLSDKAHEEIKRLILSGELRSGQLLRQEELSARLGISRTPIRQALERLSEEALVCLVPGRGASVAEFSIEDLRDAFEARAVLEGYAARSAVSSISPGAFERMEALLDEHLAAWERGDTDRVFACDSEFHATLLAYTRNRRIVSLIGGLADQTAIYRVRRMASQTRLRKSIEEHRMILEAARNRDAERIQDLMTNHLLGFCREALHEWLGGGLF